NRNNIRNMTAAISFDNGGSFDRVQELDTADWFLQSCPSTGGDGFFNDQYLHTIWSSGRTGISKVYYSRLNMDSWKIDEFQIMNHSLGRNFQQTYPRISGGNDTVGVVWSELVNSMDVFFSWFTGYQTADLVKHTVRVNQAITGNQAAADVAYGGQNFYLCWQDLNDNSIVFKSSRIKTSTDADNGLQDIPLRIRMDRQHAEIESDQPMDHWRFSDLQGRILDSGNLDQRISIARPSSGIYLFHYSIGAQSRSLKLVF
ncbi:MAG TPA: hypothetical protein VFX48_00085, partial [Saprospiraceae bacterium]|nr:hypothetical protein [Saprospiraceae bacterium]